VNSEPLSAEITPLGDAALIIRFAVPPQSQLALQTVRKAVQKLEAAPIPGVAEFAASYHTIAAFLDLTELGRSPGDVTERTEEIANAIKAALSDKFHSSKTARRPRQMQVPVCYAGEFAPDLARVAEHSGLTPHEVIELHCAAEFTVACIGFIPGFPYLIGLPEKLHVPRLATPRTRIPAGSVAIAAAQAGIYPHDSPGGWNVIGRTPLHLFDARNSPPALLFPGDEVRFRSITREQFDAVAAA
jgi:inhibitor of KinA